MDNLTTIEGTIREVIFHNESNGYTVCAVEVDGVLVTAVCYMTNPGPGETVRLRGKYVMHADYGEQFKAEFCERCVPETKEAILAYLSSGVIKGVRASTAAKIVDKFGEKALDVIRSKPERLTEIKGISLSRAMDISRAFIEKEGARHIVMFLSRYGVSTEKALKVWRTLGTEAVEEIKKNPYVLCSRVDGIGFLTADRIALAMGIEKNSPERISEGIKYVLIESAFSGNVYMPKPELCAYSSEVLGTDGFEVENLLESMVFDGRLISDGEAIYLTPYYNAELAVARNLIKLALFERKIRVSEEALERAERECGITLSDEQRNAVIKATENSVVVITGGPGTGKTTIIKVIIHLMHEMGLTVALAAPTGRAAKRMSEACQMEAKTIHRLLEIGYSDENAELEFTRSEAVPLEDDVIIVDELSMVDILLMNSLLKALKPGARLIMVGDADQLPSVGPGNVLKDIIQSGCIETVRLTEIYRQAAESMIIVNAHRINRGEEPYLNIQGKDFFFLKRSDFLSISETIADLCKNRLPSSYGYNPITQIQVLSPAKKTVAGVYKLNRLLQENLNPPSPDKKEKPYRDMVFREGDKVMQIKNNYDIAWYKDGGCEGHGVFNGDIGFIKSINLKNSNMTVEFDDGRCVVYDFGNLEELELAYAVTVHKSQGCEFPAVVMPVAPFAPMLMTRNILYTAITRAKELLILVGREDMLSTMINNNTEAKRYSGLCERLKELMQWYSLKQIK